MVFQPAQTIPFINPSNGLLLERAQRGESMIYVDQVGCVFRFERDILFIEDEDNYTNSFGFQWNRFRLTQIDEVQGSRDSEVRLFATTGWTEEDLDNKNILEVGCGAGRFTNVLLTKTTALVHSIDYSDSINVTRDNNEKFTDRLRLARASIYKIPFPDKAFDKVLCLGVLQHTPSVEDSLRSLIRKVKPGGELVVDFYELKGWYTKIHCKYLLRPLTTRMPPDLLLRIITMSTPLMLRLFDTLYSLRLGVFTRFLPIADIRGSSKARGEAARLQSAILDTFDAFSPEFDSPTTIKRVVEIVTQEGLTVKFAGRVSYHNGQAAVVRATNE